MSAEVVHGTCPDALAGFADATFDAVVTDPPYELGFMGKGWDASGIAYSVPLWSEVLRVLKPGGHLLAFGGTRTWHRMVVAIEDAGFGVRDELVWLYGSGFPKSLDVSKAIDKAAGAERAPTGRVLSTTRNRSSASASMAASGLGAIGVGPQVHMETAPATPDAERWNGWGTALKPAHEPICLARKPLVGTVAENVLTHGTGALNVDGCRVAAKARPHISADGGGESVGVYGDGLHGSRNLGTADLGRWPANVVLDEEAAAMLDQQSGVLHSQDPATRTAKVPTDGWGPSGTDRPKIARTHSAGGTHEAGTGASRFFYVAKAAKHERPRLEDGTAHATVKPVALMRWLVRLVTPPGGLVLDPFAGSGTTGEACIAEGFRCVLVEQDADHVRLIEQRLSKPIQTGLPL